MAMARYFAATWRQRPDRHSGPDEPIPAQLGRQWRNRAPRRQH
ncbi:hypothetical protein ABZ436_03190 [Micromonospora matsumotoense]